MQHPLRKLRVDHIGSFLRPQSLIEAFREQALGRRSLRALEDAQDEAIRAVIARQAAAGLPIASDGEYRRLNWQLSFSQVSGWDLFTGSLKGFLASPDLVLPGETPGTRGEDAVVSFRTPATARLALQSNFPLREYRFAAAAAANLGSDAPAAPAKVNPALPVKAMIMGPDRVAQMCDIDRSRGVYDSVEDLLGDVVAIQRTMVSQLLDAGCPYIQLDEPSYTGYVDAPTLQRLRARGEDPMANLDRAIAADNAVISGFADRATFAVHICRGNRASMWHREGTYDAIADRLFNNLQFDRLLLEYDTSRAGGFEPLRYVPAGKMVVLGLITTKTGEVERVDDLRRRIDEAAKFVSLDQLAISPQCGFASGIAGNFLTEEQQWRKIDVMLEVARLTWT